MTNFKEMQERERSLQLAASDGAIFNYELGKRLYPDDPNPETGEAADDRFMFSAENRRDSVIRGIRYFGSHDAMLESIKFPCRRVNLVKSGKKGAFNPAKGFDLCGMFNKVLAGIGCEATAEMLLDTSAFAVTNDHMDEDDEQLVSIMYGAVTAVCETFADVCNADFVANKQKTIDAVTAAKDAFESTVADYTARIQSGDESESLKTAVQELSERISVLNLISGAIQKVAENKWKLYGKQVAADLKALAGVSGSADIAELAKQNELTVVLPKNEAETFAFNCFMAAYRMNAKLAESEYEGKFFVGVCAAAVGYGVAEAEFKYEREAMRYISKAENRDKLSAFRSDEVKTPYLTAIVFNTGDIESIYETDNAYLFAQFVSGFDTMFVSMGEEAFTDRNEWLFKDKSYIGFFTDGTVLDGDKFLPILHEYFSTENIHAEGVNIVLRRGHRPCFTAND